MIIEAKALKLVKIYCYLTEKFSEGLKYSCERMSNNRPELTDEEIMAIYIFAVCEQQYFKIKQIHRFADEYLRDWFPSLGSYAAYNNRINGLSETFKFLTALILSESMPSSCSYNESILDSVPIITCSGKRSPKVATELIDKTYCASKNLWYSGLKLHVLGFHRPGKLPLPEEMILTPASANDLSVFKQAWSGIEDRTFYGDKIYCDKPFFSKMQTEKNSIMMTPVKAIKGQSEWEKNFNKAADDIYSKAVSAIRQPIESLFNWLIEKTGIQNASKVRSTKGLLIHVFGKIAAAFIYLVI